MRHSYLLAALPLALGLVPLLAHGCAEETAFESLCDWVANPDNCYREFRAGMLEGDGGPSALAPGCTFPGTQPTLVADRAHAPTGVSNGTFQTRPMLGTCIIDSGGSVTFSPPINLAAYPPSLLSTPITYTMTLADAFGVTCGTATYTSPHGFSISIVAPTGAGGGGASGGGGGLVLAGAGHGGSDGGFQATPAYGTYAQTIAPGRDAFDVTCPSGETHYFNLDESGDSVELAAAETSSCPGYEDLVPSASLQIDPGGVDRPGAVSFAIVYPDVGPGAVYPPFQASAEADASFNPDANHVPPPQTVVYFNCAIPAASPQCMDGTKDGAETDVDCGGPSVNGCPARCEGGQACDCNGDCASSLCFVDPTSGTRRCYDPMSPPTSSDGALLNVGHGVGLCGYTSICGANRCSGATPTCCSGSCVDTGSDPKNCGGCGQACCMAAPACQTGACSWPSDAGASCSDAG